MDTPSSTIATQIRQRLNANVDQIEVTESTPGLLISIAGCLSTPAVVLAFGMRSGGQFVLAGVVAAVLVSVNLVFSSPERMLRPKVMYLTDAVWVAAMVWRPGVHILAGVLFGTWIVAAIWRQPVRARVWVTAREAGAATTGYFAAALVGGDIYPWYALMGIATLAVTRAALRLVAELAPPPTASPYRAVLTELHYLPQVAALGLLTGHFLLRGQALWIGALVPLAVSLQREYRSSDTISREHAVLEALLHYLEGREGDANQIELVSELAILAGEHLFASPTTSAAVAVRRPTGVWVLRRDANGGFAGGYDPAGLTKAPAAAALAQGTPVVTPTESGEQWTAPLGPATAPFGVIDVIWTPRGNTRRTLQTSHVMLAEVSQWYERALSDERTRYAELQAQEALAGVTALRESIVGPALDTLRASTARIAAMAGRDSDVPAPELLEVLEDAAVTLAKLLGVASPVGGAKGPGVAAGATQRRKLVPVGEFRRDR